MPSQSFAAWPDSIPAARRYVSEELGSVPPNLCQTAALLVSELATNAVRHAEGYAFVVEIEVFPLEGRLWIGVTDADMRLPILRAPSVTAEHGRGMRLVASLSSRWGARRRRDTTQKTVWFELDYPPSVPA